MGIKISSTKPSYGTLNDFKLNKPESINLNATKSIKCLKIIAILSIITLFISTILTGYILKFYSLNEYNRLFNNHIKLTLEYDSESLNSFLPIINLELKNKNIQLTNRLVTSNLHLNKHQKSNIFTKLINYLTSNYYFTFKLKNNFYFNIKQQNEFSKEKLDFNINKVVLTNDNDIQCFNVNFLNKNINKQRSNGDMETCFSLNDNLWFGGHESYEQPYWPINNQTFDYVAYVTGFPDDWGAVVERYWLSSNGVAIFVDDNIPLFVKHLDPNQICLKSSKDLAPYLYTQVYEDVNQLEYTICSGSNTKLLHTYMIENYLGKPLTRPDLLMMKLPIFTTWSYFFKSINQSLVLDYANQISLNNYTISQLEIDDKWEKSYGDLDFDTNKFPNVNEMISKLHSLNMRVTLWIHPFCNVDSYNFANGTENSYWILDPSGEHPAFTKWWNGKNSVILDTTNPSATNYYTQKLNYLKQTYKIDSFKFDAGETAWLPSKFKLNNNKSKPDEYAQNYVKIASEQNNFVEVRVGHRNQKYGLFYRILDRASDWSIHDGLKSVITQTLQFGILGYPYVLPDIIGGNDDPNKNNKELFIRWTQLTAFLPAMQFGVPPWFYDQETNLICQKFVNIHINLVYPYISKLPIDGLPIIRPIWWFEPDNMDIFDINDQFLVGDYILVAPILDPGVTSRPVYFPNGDWYDVENKYYIKGPINLIVNSTINSIPYYLNRNNKK